MKDILQRKVSKIYAVIAIAVSLLCLLGYFSYAMFTVSETKENALSIVTGGLNYTIMGTGVTNNRITVTAGSNQSVTLTVTSQNDIDSKYQLYYQNNSNVDVYYLESNEDPFGTMEANGSIRITILIKNNASSSQTITLGVQGGYPANDITLDSGRTAVDEVGSFSVTTRSVTGGTVTVSSSAQVGSTVTFTTSPSSGFSYYGATIRDSSGSTLMTLNSSTKSFTMPSEDVVVSPKWKHDDFDVMVLDKTHDTTWSSDYVDGSTMSWGWDANRHYFGGTIATTGNARRAFWTDKAYDLTHYASFRIHAYEYTIDSNYNTDNYHITMYAGVSTTKRWVNQVSPKATMNAPGNMKYAYLVVDITNVTGNYYLGFEILSNSHPFACNVTDALLIGRVYE